MKTKVCRSSIFRMLVFAFFAACIFGSCSKTAHKVANPVAVEVYKVSITQFPESPPGGGTWDTKIIVSDPFGRPELAMDMTDDMGNVVGAPGGYMRLNCNHGNLPINFDVDTLKVIPLDRVLFGYVYDQDEFDPDDYMAGLQSDTLSKFKEEQPGYITLTSGGVTARVYIKWK